MFNKSCPTLWDPMDYSIQASLFFTIFLEFAQTHVHWVGDVIQQSHPLLSPSPPVFSLPQGLFQWVSSLCMTGYQTIGASASASVLPMNIQGWIPLGLTSWISLLPKGLSRVFSNTTVQSISSSALNVLYGSTLTFLCDCWKNHNFDCTDVCGQSGVSAF